MNNYLSIILLSSFFFSSEGITQTTEKEVKVPFQYAVGKNLFEKNCSNCHGVTGDGSYEGPPLMHKIYEPSHHGDAAFYRAALNGAKAHHWNFGDMPPVPGITERDVSKIVPYVRWLQQQRGIK